MGLVGQMIHWISASLLLAMLFQKVHDLAGRMDDQRVDALLLGQGQRLEDLFLGIVVGRQAANVPQLPAVSRVGKQVAAQQQTADLHFANLALGQTGLRRRIGPRGGPCCGATRR